VALKFSVSPLSVVMLLEKNIKKGSVWQVIYLISLSFTLSYFSFFGIKDYLLVYVFHELLLYSIYLLIIYQSSSNNK
jgi:formate hydrogenlyase subunit 3/multisubunit Na+/H+ antiporter MnhD subunit